MKPFLLALLLSGLLFSATAAELAEIDSLESLGAYQVELTQLNRLVQNDPGNVEILWRLAQAHFEIADQTDDADIDRAQLYPGLEAARSALRADSTSARANHWYAVLMGQVGMLEGTRQKIINSYDVRKYALRAIQLDPAYDGTYHVMGRWHYELGSLNWFEKKIAELVYTKLPEGSYAEAEVFFRKAIQAKPDEIRHYVWLAKTLIEENKESEARLTLQDALALNAATDSDRRLQQEARELLEDL
ncbi:MAG: tetratricopeptide repeat protein [FCB group bacterium]|nr:tetratricopeptide repeat protein [FCB group bacterium]